MILQVETKGLRVYRIFWGAGFGKCYGRVARHTTERESNLNENFLRLKKTRFAQL
jgi:hypothetical protein